MEPIKTLFPLSTWMLRLAVLLIVYICFFVEYRTPNFSSTNFYIAVAFGFFGMLLFIGGFLKKSGLTMLSAALLFIGCLYKIISYYAFSHGRFVAIFGVFAAITFFFIANGNKKK
ncbi:MAG: hypothetical protein WCM76_02470 [Bacteroidota bacterium]